MEDVLIPTTENQENKRFLSWSYTSEKEFVSAYKKCYYGKTKAKELYLLALIELEKTISKGNIKGFKNFSSLIGYINSVESQETLKTYYDNTENPLKRTNLVIATCKYNNVEILNYLLDNNCKIFKDLSFKVGRHTILPNDEDETCHNAFYYAIRSGNVKLLDTLINKWPHDYFSNHLEELEFVLANAYDELKLKNVPLSDETIIFVESKLTDLRFFSKNSLRNENDKTIDNIKERITLVLENIALLHSTEDKVDDRFIYIAKFIARNLHTLKIQLKSTYGRLPWEEMEFCLVVFVSSHIKHQEMNLFYNAFLNKGKILNHLENFANKLNEERENMEDNYSKLAELPKLSRDKVVADVINISPLFAALYDDYQQIRDIHSLNKIDTYLTLAVGVDSKEREGQLAITRSLQVIGECLKNTLESPKLSKCTSELLVLSLPKNTRKIIIEVRDSLSHTQVLSKRTEIEENSDVNFFTGIQNDVKEIRIIIRDILYDYKIKVITIILKNIIDSDNLEEIKEVAKLLTHAELDEVKLIESFPKRQLEKMEKLIEELNNIVIEKTSREKEIFNRMHTIINSGKSDITNNRTDYALGFTIIKNMSNLLSNTKYDCNTIQNLKFSSDKLLENIIPKVKFGSLEIITLCLQIFLSVRSRIPPYNLEELNLVILKICYAVNGVDDITWLNKLKLIFNKVKLKKSINTCGKLKKKHGHQLSLKLSELKRILTKNSLNNLIKAFPSYKKNKKLQAAIEMLVLDIMSILGSSHRCLANVLHFLEESSPLLIGKGLRNHIAHDNAIVEVLLSDLSIGLILNACKLTEGNIVKNKKQIGRSVNDDPSKLKEKYGQDLDNLNNQERMFAACEEGNLENFKCCIIKGADLNSRNLNQWTALHFAAKGSSLEVTKFILDQNLSVNVKDINKQNPLHIAVANGRERLAKILVEEVGLNIDEADINGKTPLHLAAGNGYEDIVKVLLKNKADTKIKDRLGYFPLHYAVHNNYKEVVEVLLEKEVNLDIFETNGGFTLLHMTADKGYLELTNFLLERGADVNSKLDSERTPLHSAAFHGHLEVVNTLILKGAAVNARVIGGCTPLHYALETGYENVADILLKHGANANIADKTYMNTPLHYAARFGREGILKILLQNNVNSNASTVEGMTPLHLAVKNGHTKIVIDLLNHGVEINAKTTTSCTALHLAALMGGNDIVNILIQNEADVNAKAVGDYTSLYFAAKMSHKEIVKILIKNKAIVDARDINSSTPLHAAAMGGNRDVVDILIKNKAKVNGKDNDDLTPLHAAAQTGFTNVIDLLINCQADINSRSIKHLTPLHLCVKNGHIDAVTLLIKTKADINARDIEGNSPLHIASEQGNKEVVEILIANGAIVDAKNRNERTPLFSAVQCGNKIIIEVLITNGANINTKGKCSSREIITLFSNINSEDVETTPLYLSISGDNREIAEFLIKKGAQVDLQYAENVTLLHLAAHLGLSKIVNILIKNGAEVNALTIRNETPLHLAAEKGFEEVVEILIAKGANVDSETSEGATPLNLAASKGFNDVVEVLLSNGAKINVEDKKKRKPIELATAHGHLQVVKIVLQHKEADVNAKGHDNWTVLHIAALGGILEVVKLLVGLGANINARNSLGSKPIHIAAKLGSMEMVEYFIKMGLSINDLGSANMTLLHFAAAGGKMDVAKYLIEHGVDVNAVDSNGSSPIYHATHFGHKDVIEFLLSNGAVYDATDNFNRKPLDITTNEDVIKLLTTTKKLLIGVKKNNISEVENSIKNGAFINSKNSKFETPLHIATWKGNDAIVNVLLQSKSINPNIVGSQGHTPLHYAAKFSRLQIAKALLSSGAIFNALSHNGKTPLEFAVDKSICNLLKLVHDSFKNIKNNNSKVINDLNKIKDIGTIKAVMNARNRENKTLIVVAINNNFPKVKELKGILQENVSSKVNEALTLLEQENYQPALVIFKRVLEKRKEILGPDNPGTLDIQLNIARTLYKQGTYHEALSIQKEVSQKQNEIFGPNDTQTLRTRGAIALTLHRLGKNEEAYQIFQEVYQMQNQILGSYHSDVLSTQLHMALVLNVLGKCEEALSINQEVFENTKESLGANHPDTLSAQNNIAMVLSHNNKLEEAKNVYGEVFERRKLILGMSHSDTLRTLHNIAGVLLLQKKYHEALKHLIELYEIQRNILGPNHPDTVNTQFSISNTLFVQGKYIGALKAFKEGLELRKAMYGPSHESVLDTQKKMEVIDLAFKYIGYESKFLQDLQQDINSAVAKGDIKSVQYLIEKGADVNNIDIDGRASLHYAADNGHISIVKILLNEGADATQTTSKGNTPLHTAASKGYKDIVEALLQHVCRNKLYEFVNAQTNVGGATSLHVAAKNGFLEVAKSLLQYGATYNMENKNGETPFDLSKDKNVYDLLNLTEELFEEANNGNIKLIIILKSLKHDEFQAVTNARDIQGKTLLQILIGNNDKAIARVLLEMLK